MKELADYLLLKNYNENYIGANAKKMNSVRAYAYLNVIYYGLSFGMGFFNDTNWADKDIGSKIFSSLNNVLRSVFIVAYFYDALKANKKCNFY